jgi:hypothetical protein
VGVKSVALRVDVHEAHCAVEEGDVCRFVMLLVRNVLCIAFTALKFSERPAAVWAFLGEVDEL